MTMPWLLCLRNSCSGVAATEVICMHLRLRAVTLMSGSNYAAEARLLQVKRQLHPFLVHHAPTPRGPVSLYSATLQGSCPLLR